MLKGNESTCPGIGQKRPSDGALVENKQAIHPRRYVHEFVDCQELTQKLIALRVGLQCRLCTVEKSVARWRVCAERDGFVEGSRQLLERKNFLTSIPQ